MGKLRLGTGPVREIYELDDLDPGEFEARLEKFGEPLYYLIDAVTREANAAGENEKPEIPSMWQLLVLTSCARRTVVSAGRRGGKTAIAAWRAAFQSWPKTQREFLKLRGVRLPSPGRTITGTIVTPKVSAYQATYQEYLSCLRRLGLVKDKDFVYDKQERAVYFPNKDEPVSQVFFKGTLDDDGVGRGPDNSWSWWDEVGAMKGSSAWEAFEPSLLARLGAVDFTMTPGTVASQWWSYDLFIEKGHELAEIIQWTSIEAPHIDWEEIETARRNDHPLKFRREYEAVWEKGGDQDLNPDWIIKNAYKPDDIKRDASGNFDRSRYRLFYGVDPAISMSSRADDFARVGFLHDQVTGHGYFFDMFADKIPAPEQVKHLESLFVLQQPDAIGIESVAYQQALHQHLMASTANVPAIEIRPKGDKGSRIRAMSVGFANGRFHVPEAWCKADHKFFKQWTEFPDAAHDDVLDACDIAWRTAGYLGVDVSLANEVARAEGVGGETERQRMAREMMEADIKGIEEEDEANDWINW